MQTIFEFEAAIDEGAPKQKYSRLVVAEIGNNNLLFDAHPQQFVMRHNLIELAGCLYLTIG